VRALGLLPHYTISVGGTERGYYLIPSTSSDPVPLVFEFHGRGGDGQGIVSSFGLETSLGGAAVLVAPDGLDQGGGTGWGNGNDSEDIALVKALIERMTADHCVDSARIYALGFSWGGWMATQTGCALGGSLAGFVSVEGGGPMGKSCAGPVAGMVVHGTADTAEPIASGIATRDAFRTIDGCSDALGSSPVSGCEQYPSCEKPLLWCQHDGAHLIPDFVLAGLPSFFALTP
jgi:poly(3-hydroxybutyrate) depolymerase